MTLPLPDPVIPQDQLDRAVEAIQRNFDALGMAFPIQPENLAITSPGGSPTGAAGGDLAGSYPNPLIGAGKITDSKVAAGIAQSKISGLVSALAGKQAADGTLSVLSGLSTTAYGRGLLGLANVSAALTYLGAAAVVHTHTLSQVTDAGTAASKNIAVSGNAASTEVVKGNDTRLTDARTPTAHIHPQSQVTGLVADLGLKAPLASPIFTGNPTAPTAPLGDSDSSVATTAFTQGLAQLTAAGFSVKPQVDYGTVQALDAHTGTGTGTLTATANGTLLDALGLETARWNYSTTFAYPFTPYAIARTSGGDFYVTGKVGGSDYKFVQFNSAGVALSTFGSNGTGNGQFGGPCGGIAVDSSGNIYVADTSNNRVQKFNSSGTYVSQFGTNGAGNGQFSFPQGLALDGPGNIYVVDRNNFRVQKFNSSGAYVAQVGSNGSGNGQFIFPVGIGRDSSNNIYVADTNNNRVQKFNSSLTYQSQFGSYGAGNGEFSSPSGIAVDASNNIYVAQQTQSRVQKFNSSGVYISQAGAYGTAHGQFRFLYGNCVAVDSSGNLFVADVGNDRVERFNFTAADPTGQSVLVKDEVPNEAGHVDHGPYTVATPGSPSTKWKLTRREDADESAEIPSGLLIQVAREGARIPGIPRYVSNPDPVTVGTTELRWEKFQPGGYPTAHAASHSPDGDDPLATDAATTITGSNAEGSSTSFARADHDHAIATAAATTITGSNAEGTSASFARADHDHALPDMGLNTYRTIHEVGAGATGFASVTTVRGGFMANGTIIGSSPRMIYLKAADYAIPGMTTKLRIRAQAMSNATNPNVTVTFGLSYIGPVGGGTGAITPTYYTPSSGSTVALTANSATNIWEGVSGDFVDGGDYWYAITLIGNRVQAANSYLALNAQLQVTHV